MLTSCGWKGKEFTCEFKVVKGGIVAVSYDGKLRIEFKLKEVSNVIRDGDTLIITDIAGEPLAVKVKTGMTEAINYVMQYLEMRDKGDEILDGLITIATVLSNILSTSFDIIKSLKRGSFPDWESIEDLSLHLKETVDKNLRPHLPSMKSVDDLIGNVRMRYVTGVRINVKTLLRESVLASKKFLNSLTELINLESFIDVVLLLHAYFVADSLGLVLEKEKTLINLKEVLAELHSRVFAMDEIYGRSLTNWVVKKVQESGSADEVLRGYIAKFNEFILDYYQVRIPETIKP
ncbi:MAG: hypothetical protein J7L55_03925 [Desulfurococcales archaeon]|nr:hypothetical protein [Desulfurococcales archaeon]